MSQTVKVRVDAGGNVILPVGRSFGGQEVSITYDIDTSVPVRPLLSQSGIRPPRVATTVEEYRTFIDDLYGAYDGDLPEPDDTPTTPEKVF